MRIKGKDSFIKLSLLSTVLFLFAGCAVMTVDVDVYKGPMSNHEDVQMQQLAVMAAGAEPLLVRLRDGLEWGHFSRKNVKETGNIELDTDGSLVHRTLKRLKLISRDKAVKYSRDDIQYSKKALYDIPTNGGKTGDGEIRIFKDDTADAVNGILALYDVHDHNKEGIRQLLEKYLDAINKDGIDNAIKEKNNLLYAMVRFAEKILILTNNEVLMGDGDLFGDGIGFLGNEKFKYTTLLQSIGNSILVQADEIKHQELHEELLEKKVGSEILALNHVLSRSPEKVIGDIQSSVGAQLESAQKNKSDNLDEIETVKGSREETINSFLASKPTTIALTGTDDDVIANLKNSDQTIKQFITGKTKLKNSFKNSFEILEEIKQSVLKQYDSGQTVDISVNDLAAEIVADHVNPRLDGVDTDSLKIHKYARWKDAETFLTGALLSSKTEDKKRDKAYEEIVSLAEIEFDKADYCIQKADELKKFNNQLSQLYELKKSVLGEITKIENTKVIIESIKDDVIKKASTADLQASGPIVFAFLKDMINTKLEVEQDTTKSDKLKNALYVINNKITPPIGSLDLAGKLPLDDDDTNAKDILDTLITVLRDEHIMAIKENKGYAKDIENALAAAYEHRSSMVYIRPPSAFLRSSYPVTTFQDSPQLGWRNMLGESGLRGIPVVSSLLGWASSAHSRQKAREEIDKQFWHNINRVRVSGAGDTNYVVAKDDVGNWYVKSYSSDTKDIIKAAQSLAMFNLSGSMGVDMVDRLRKYTDSIPGEGSGTKSDASLSSIERLYVKHTKSFNEQTIDDYNSLVSMLNDNDKLETKIQNAVDSIVYINENSNIQGKLKLNLEKVSDNILGPAVSNLTELPKTTDEKRVKELGNEIIDLLYTTIRYRNVLTANITSQNMITAKATSELESEKTKKKNQEGELKTAIDEFKKTEVDLGNKTAEFNKQEEEVERLERNRDSLREVLSQIKIANAGSENPSDTSAMDNSLRESEAEYNSAKRELDALNVKLGGLKDGVDAAKDEVNNKKDEFVLAEERVNEKEGLLEKANKAEELVVDKITGEVRTVVVKLYNRRNDSVNSYGTSVSFIGDAVNPVSDTDESNIPNELKNLSNKGIN